MTLRRIPLLAHATAEAIVAYRAGQPISAQQFLADARALAARFPAGRHVLNACVDRYHFAVGFAAGVIAGRTSLLPPTQLPQVIRQLRAFAPDAFCLADGEVGAIDLPLLRYPSRPARPGAWSVPAIAARQCVACVFTSGSTGTPVAHAKTWGPLVENVRREACRLGLNDGRHHVLVATVPPQHMYGFESSVMVALQAGQAFCAERPFYPADIAGVLAAVPRARTLVSTPIHLRALLATDIELPALDLVVSATAPLEVDLAHAVEARWAAPLVEIYGSTETGQIASRRTTAAREWQLWPGVALRHEDGRTWAAGGHIETATLLGDIIEILPDGRFLLCGRTEDMVNVAGKRTSLAFLNHQLNGIPGVVDGVFFVREPVGASTRAATARVGAIVVAPGLARAAITRQLRERLDPVFLPRPLLMVEHIPRNATGKLPRAVLQTLLERA